MLKKHFDGLGFKKDARDDPKKEKGGDKEDNKDNASFPAVHDCYMIYGRPSTQLTARQRKRERREVFTERIAVPQYLSWSSTPITFDREDHPDKVVAPGVYPLVVDPIIVNTRLSKVLMDGGSSLNIIYLETLDLLGIDRGRLQPSAGGFHGVVPGKKARRPTSERRPSPLRWWGSGARTTPSSGARATPNSWLYPTTPT